MTPAHILEKLEGTPLQGWFDKPREDRNELIAKLTGKQRADLLKLSAAVLNTPYGIFRDDPYGFITFILGEHLWSKQREICEAVADNPKVAVPATNSCGKSFLMSRMVVWWVCAHDPKTTRVVTFAPSFRQVRDIIWKELRKLHNSHDLPGRLNQTEWLIDGMLVANGFSGGEQDETKVQGIHEQDILVIVDEAAGIHPTVGESFRAIYTNPDAKIVAIGNPPTDDGQGFKWFENICTNGASSWEVRKIRAWDLPSLTGEWVPAEAAAGLTSKAWVDELVRDFGRDHPWCRARLDVEFVESTSATMINKQWVEGCIGRYSPNRAGVIKLGVDVSATGGDEYVVALADGQNFSIIRRTSGEENQDQMEIADQIYTECILPNLEIMTRRINSGALDQQRMVVRVDGGGLGGPVADMFRRKVSDNGLSSKVYIDSIDFGTKALDAERFPNVRAEMYWVMREALRTGSAILIPDDKASEEELVSQLSSVRVAIGPDKRWKLETKKEMKKRGVKSPDLADAICLAAYNIGGPAAVVNAVPGGVAVARGTHMVGMGAGNRNVNTRAVRPTVRYKYD